MGSLLLERLEHRAIQVGLGGEAVDKYVDDWVAGLSDVTPLAHEIGRGLERAFPHVMPSRA
jgi:hypothetical protein